MNYSQMRAHAAALNLDTVVQHILARGWKEISAESPILLFAHPDHELRQLILPRDPKDVGWEDAMAVVVLRLADVERVSAEQILRELSLPPTPTTDEQALEAAIVAGRQATCAKSQRGVVIFSRTHGILASGWNGPPSPFRCDGSSQCRDACNKLTVHAETAALLSLGRNGLDEKGTLEMLHVKVVGGEPVSSGPPSCWQCSREVLASGIEKFWLLHEDGLRSYTAEEFHEHTLRNTGLPVIR